MFGSEDWFKTEGVDNGGFDRFGKWDGDGFDDAITDTEGDGVEATLVALTGQARGIRDVSSEACSCQLVLAPISHLTQSVHSQKRSIILTYLAVDALC